MSEYNNRSYLDLVSYAADGPRILRAAAIDEDISSLERIKELITQIEGVEFLKGFDNPAEGIAYVKEQRVDVIFLAVAMTSIQGIHVARQIEEIESAPAIAFVTKERDYSYDAWRTSAIDYILKPVKKEDLERALGRARYYKLFRELEAKKDNSPKKIFVKCFPSFDVFVEGEIMEFTYGKVKELLAFLIYQQGNWCSIDQIIFAILEEMGEKKAKQYYRTLMYRLRHILGQYKIDYILETGYGQARIKPIYFTCEYYEYLRGEKGLFQGSFMGTYMWAEDTMVFMMMQNKKKLQ